MARTLALSFLGAASVVILLTFVGVGGPWVFALAAGAFPVGLMALGASRGGVLGPVRWVLVALLLLIVGSVVGMMLLRGQVAAGPWVLGLPAAAALQLFGLVLLPLVVTSLGFALTFDRWGPSEVELEALRKRFGKLGSGGGDG